ncbi:MAG: alpha/beta hydrolase family protein [Chloroflexota bacterium]
MQNRRSNERALAALALFFLMASTLVALWYLLIAAMPDGPWNPLPPQEQAAVGGSSVGLAQARAEATWPPTWTPTATGTARPTGTITPTPSHTPTRRPATPTNTPDPRLDYYITRLQKRTFKGGQVHITGDIPQSDAYAAYYIAYPSGDLTISGYMYVPHGNGPFPVIILGHGYYDPELYFTGTGTQREADYLARQGYLTIAPDYRNYGASGSGESLLLVGYVEDVLNLVSSVRTIDKADPARIGMWGHSMGGGIVIKAGVVSRQIKALALFGAVAADEVDNYYWNAVTRSNVVALFGLPERNPASYAWASAINYLETAPPMSIHHGQADDDVPIRFSEKLYEKMRQARRPVEFFTYPGQPHTFQAEAWELAMERVVAFFDQYLK